MRIIVTEENPQQVPPLVRYTDATVVIRRVRHALRTADPKELDAILALSVGKVNTDTVTHP